MSSRNIGDLARLIDDILEYADENDMEAILLSADFEEAFDSGEIWSLFSPSEHLALVIKKLSKKYKIKSLIMVDQLSFILERGARQEDPLYA